MMVIPRSCVVVFIRTNLSITSGIVANFHVRRSHYHMSTPTLLIKHKLLGYVRARHYEFLTS